MRKVLPAVFFSVFTIFTILSLAPFQNAASQTEDQEYANEEKKWLRNDLKVSDIVAYVSVKTSKIADSVGDGSCETNTGNGYCLYLLTAEVREVLKGKIATKSLEFYTSAETGYPKKNLLGEQIVFLVWNEGKDGKEKTLGTIENSSRGGEILETMRKIADPKTPVDDADETDPYSLVSIKKAFDAAEAVIYADVKSFKEDTEDISYQDFILQAEIAEVLKGNFKANEKIEYLDDLTYRRFNQDDLGKQIIFLEKQEENGKVFYSKIKYTADFVKNELLEKLHKIAAEKSSAKSTGVQK